MKFFIKKQALEFLPEGKVVRVGTRLIRRVAVLNLFALLVQIMGTAVPFLDLKNSSIAPVISVLEEIKEVVSWGDINEDLAFLSTNIFGIETAYAAPSFTYSKTITISGTSGAGTNYIVPFDIK